MVMWAVADLLILPFDARLKGFHIRMGTQPSTNMLFWRVCLCV